MTRRFKDDWRASILETWRNIPGTLRVSTRVAKGDPLETPELSDSDPLREHLPVGFGKCPRCGGEMGCAIFKSACRCGYSR